MAIPNYPEIKALNSALSDHDIHLSVEPHDVLLRTWSYKRIRMPLPRNRAGWSVPVDDEYEDAVDLLVWAKDTGFDPSEAWGRAFEAYPLVMMKRGLPANVV